MVDEPKPDTPSEETPKEELIPKEELNKVVSDKDNTISSLKADLDKASMQLLDPEYVEWRDSRRRTKEAPRPTPKSGESPELAEIREYVEGLEGRLQDSNTAIRDLLASQELVQTRDRYPDFNEYEEEIKTVLQNAQTDLTFEQAYRIAKSYKAEQAVLEEEAPKKPFATEKPSGTVPAKALEPKEFKTTEEANKATIAALKDKYPDLGDTI